MYSTLIKFLFLLNISCYSFAQSDTILINEVIYSPFHPKHKYESKGRKKYQFNSNTEIEFITPIKIKKEDLNLDGIRFYFNQSNDQKKCKKGFYVQLLFKDNKNEDSKVDSEYFIPYKTQKNLLFDLRYEELILKKKQTYYLGIRIKPHQSCLQYYGANIGLQTNRKSKTFYKITEKDSITNWIQVPKTSIQYTIYYH